MLGILGRVIGQAEESLAHLRGGIVAQRCVPGIDPAEPVEPVIGRAIERQHIEPVVHQRDEGEEQRTVEPVLVEVPRRAIGRRHHRHAFVDHQRGKEPGHDRCIGGVGDDHLVEGEAAHVGRDALGDACHRALGLLLALFADHRVDLEHEGVKMDPPLALDAERGDEQVHQHGFAAPDTAPHIDPARGLGLAAQQFAEEAAGIGLGFEFLLQLVEPLGGGALIGIGAQFVARDERIVFCKQTAHGRFLSLRTMPE